MVEVSGTVGVGQLFGRRQIDATDRGRDALVYELYGLTAEETTLAGSPHPLYDLGYNHVTPGTFSVDRASLEAE